MNDQKMKDIDRRSFLSYSAAAGAGLIMSNVARGQETTNKSDELNIALLGTGAQGQVLMNAILKGDLGIRFKAVCDIWEGYNQRRAVCR